MDLIAGNIREKSVIKGVSILDVCEDLRIMLSNPNSTLIGNNGHYFGPAVVVNWLINNQPEKYTRLVLELAIYGETQPSLENKKLKVPGYIRDRPDVNVIDNINSKVIRENIDSTSVSDFLLTVSLVNSEKVIQKIGLVDKRATYNKKSLGSFVFTNTMPWEMDDYFRKLGVEIEDKHVYLKEKENVSELFAIEQAVVEGKMPIVFDNHLISYTRTKNFLYKFTGAHFITIHSFKVDTTNNTVAFTYWDYGKVKDNLYLTLIRKPVSTGSLKKDLKELKKFKKKGLDKKKSEISIEIFLKGMKGYWTPVDNTIKQ